MENNSEYEYGELLYFGDAYDNGKEYQDKFIAEIKEKFPLAKLTDAYDEIKGYRQQVYIPNGEKENFMAWLIAFGWFEFGLGFQLMFMSDEKEILKKYIDKAKEQYPEQLKK